MVNEHAAMWPKHKLSFSLLAMVLDPKRNLWGAMPPISHLYSNRLKLQFWGYGQDGKLSRLRLRRTPPPLRLELSSGYAARTVPHYTLDLCGQGTYASTPGRPFRRRAAK